MSVSAQEKQMVFVPTVNDLCMHESLSSISSMISVFPGCQMIMQISLQKAHAGFA